MILWSTAEAVLRLIIVFIIYNFKILWSTAEAVLRRNSNSHNFVFLDPMVYCGSGTETFPVSLCFIARF